MKKRIISFLLCMLMLASAAVSFVGCGDEEVKIYTDSKPKAMTITITTIYDDYDENNKEQVEALKLVQDALNEITEAKYNTHVVIKPMKSKDYMNNIITMSENITNEMLAEENDLRQLIQIRDENEKAKKKASIISKRKYAAKYQVISGEWLTAANSDSVYVDANGRYQTIYPSVDKNGNYVDKGNQLDIVLINSAEMYNNMVDRGYLHYIGPDLQGDSTGNNLIQKFVSQYVHDYIDIDATGSEINDLYAVPNNTVYGEYSCIIVNKALFDYYKYDINYDYNTVSTGSAGCDEFSDFENFIMDIANDIAAGNTVMAADGKTNLLADCYPILNNPDLEFLSPYGVNSTMIADAISKFNTETGAAPKPITDSLVFQSYFRTLYTLIKTDKYADVKNPLVAEWLTEEDLLSGEYADKNFGIAFTKGNLDMIEKFAGTEEEPGDYYVAVTHTPYIDNTVFESMYAISSCISADPYNAAERAARCYQILQLFSIDSDWVNLLTYGVEGEHYELSTKNDEIMVTNRNDAYTFDRRYAGNMFLQYMSEDLVGTDLGEYAENNWDLGRRQNLTLNISPYAGFSYKLKGKNYETGEFEDLEMLKPGKNDKQETMPLYMVLDAWAKNDGKNRALLAVNGEDAFKDYEAYLEAQKAEGNVTASFDDYFKYFTNSVIKGDAFYLYITSSAMNSPHTQYMDFFLLKRDTQGSYTMYGKG